MSTADTSSRSAGTVATMRYDIYAAIHKAVRNFMFDTLRRVGCTDVDDAADIAGALAQVHALGAFCTAHLKHENRFVHTAMEARQPGSSAGIAQEHEHHEWAIAQLSALVIAVEQSGGAARAAALTQLYRYLSVFVGENLVHMNIEETEHNAVLWATHTDAELIAIEHAIVASIPPQDSLQNMRWMIPAMNAGERAAKLGGIQRSAPPPVFGALMEIARESLPAREMEKLNAALAEPLAA